jgi:hypothetical protein
MIKFNVVMAFKISALLYSSDLRPLIGVDEGGFVGSEV